MHSSFYESGGQEFLPLIATMSLRKLGHEVDCFAAVINRNTCHPKIIRKANVKYYAFEMPIPFFRSSSNHFLSYALAPLYLHKFRKYDVILCFQQPSAWIAKKVKAKFNVPYVYYAQGVLRELYPRPLDIQVRIHMRIERPVAIFFADKFKLFKNIDQEAVRNADAILANSSKTKMEIQKIYGRKDVEICYPGVDTQLFRPLSAEKLRYALTKFNIQKSFLFTTNRHEPHKKLEWLLSIMRYVLKKKPDATLIAAGGFNKFYTPSLLRLCKKLGLDQKVKFVGRITQEDLISLYNASKVCVFCSPEEDFGLGPIEAMACGKPVVAWSNAGPAETVVNGETGLLAKPFDLEDFGEKVATLLNSNEMCAEMGRRGILYVKKKFSLNNFNRKLENTLSHYA